MKFDENFFEEPNKKEMGSSLKMKLSMKNHPLFDNNFNKFILTLNEENYPNCVQELNSFNSCKFKNKSDIHDPLSDRFFDILKKECYNEIVYVYNCLKRYGKYV